VTNVSEYRIAGLGCDVVGLAVLQRQVDSPVGLRFLANVLTPGEIDRCGGELAALAAHWAAKEAIAKAIGCGWTGLRPRQIELTAPRPDQHAAHWHVAHADAHPWPQDAHLWAWHISTSQTDQHSTAVAIATHEPTRNHRADGATTAPHGHDDNPTRAPLAPSSHQAQRDPNTEGTSR
jgi:phosphopantetheine--protein transferase-like protein